MGTSKAIQPADVIILIAAQFDEQEVVTCHAMLCDRQLSVLLVSVIPGLVRSIRGIMLHPDSHLSQRSAFISGKKRQMVILAGGEACAAKIVSDPRTHQLVQAVLQQGGYVVVTAKADFLVKETGLFASEWAARIFCQAEGEETAVFVEKLSDRMNTN